MSLRPTRRFLLPIALVFVALLSSKPAATLIYVSGTSGTGQDLLLRRDGDRLVLVNQQSRAIVASAPAGRTERVVVVGANDRDDTLTLDLTSPLSLPRGIDYDGGARGWDTLVVTGGSVRKETVTQLTPHDGVFDLDGLALHYTNLEPLTDTVSAASLTVNGTAGMDTVTIADGPSAGQATISSPTFESYTFSNKGSVVYDGQGGDDAVTLDNPSTPTGLASFIIQNVATVDQANGFTYPSFGVSATGTVNLSVFPNDVDNIEITTVTGDINYFDADGATIGGVSPALAGLRVIGEGSINFETVGPMTLNDSDAAEIVRSGATGGNVVLQAAGVSADISVTADNQAIVSPSGVVLVTASGSIVLGASSAFHNDIVASGDVTLNAQGDVSIGGNSEVLADDFGNGTGGTASAGAGGSFLLSGAGARFGSPGGGGGGAQVFSPNVDLSAPSASALFATSGPVNVSAARLIIDATSGISSPQSVFISNVGGSLDLGSTTDAGSDLEMSDAELDRIAAPSVVLEAANLTVTQPITYGGELALRTAGTFAVSGAGSLSAPALSFQDLGASPRTWTIDAASVTITPGTAIPYSGVATLFAGGGNGEDTFNVTPSVSTTITVAGRTPDLPAVPGDALNVNTSGTTSPFLTSTQSETGYDGGYTFANRAPINFTDIETLDASTDLAITKTDGVIAKTPGTPVTYTIVASNSGALGVGVAAVADAFPAELGGVTWTCAASPGSTCPANGAVTLDVPVTLAAGGTATFTVTGTISVAATGTLSNTATVAVPGGTTDPNPANNSATDTDTLLVLTSITTNASAGVFLSGQVSDAATLANGASPTGTITFRLFGPDDATCASAPVFTATVPVAGNGIYASGNFTPTAAGAYRWIASYSGDGVNAPSTGACNDPNESVTVSLKADLGVTKTGPGTSAAGANITYTILVSNAGPDAATAATLTDTLPGGTTFVSATPTQGSCSGTSTVSCNLGTLANGASATVTLVVSTTGTTPASVSNTASVSTTSTDPSAGNNASTAVTTVTPSADVAVTKTGPATVAAGGNVSYTITATNNGPSVAQGVTITDTLPGGTAFVSATPTQGSCSGTSTVTCNLGTVANGATATLTLVVSTTATTPASISNTASIGSTTADPALGNNVSTANTTVAPSADVTVSKTGPGTVSATSNISYTITATNNGPSAAQGVTITDTLPGGTAFVSATPTQGSCSGTSTVTCSLGTIANGGSATVTLVVSTTHATPVSISNTASVGATTGDPAPGNNSSTANTTVTGGGCSTLVATPAVLPPAIAGDPYSQTFALTNGAAPVAFTMTGTLPAGLSFSGAVLSGLPTQRGAFPVTLTATDANGCPGSFPYTISVSRDRSLAVGNGSGSLVRTLGVHSTTPRSEGNAYDPGFAGGVSVALGDTNGDGRADLVTGAGPGAGPLVRVFDGVTGEMRLSFPAYDPALASGIEVAAGDVNGDGIADIITVPGAGGPPIVRVFDGLTGGGIRQFFAMAPTWSSGLHVAAGDMNGDGFVDIIIGSGPSGPPLVQVFEGLNGALLGQFLAYDAGVQGGVYVASGDVNGDGFADIVTGAGPGGGPHVRVFDNLTGNQIAGPLGGFFAYDPAFPGGVRVAAGDFDGDGFAEVITGAGPGGGPHLRVWDGATGIETYGVYAFDPSSAGGIFVAGPPAIGRMAIDIASASAGSLRIAGWALEETSTAGPGTDAIHAWAFPVTGGAPIFVGAASGLVARPDVAGVFGGEFRMSGFDFTGPLPAGTYDLVVYVRNARSLLFDQRRVVRVTVP